ncbi:hypothetical protein ACFL1E_05090 [Candidatus Omnitrophota bacterium]
MTQFNRLTKKQLGQLLIEDGVINQEQLQEALELQKKKGGLIGELLVELGYALEEDIVQALTNQYGFPYLPLASYEIDQKVIEVIPEHVARQYCLIPVDKVGKSLTLAMANPLNIHAIEDIEIIANCTIQTFVSTSTDINQSIDRYYKKESQKK